MGKESRGKGATDRSRRDNDECRVGKETNYVNEISFYLPLCG